MAGPNTLLAEACGMVMECILYYSDNGTEWIEVPRPDEGSEPNQRRPADATAYSESFGYVATPWSAPGAYVSSNGRDWQYLPQWPDIDRLTASGDRAVGVGEFGTAYLLIYHETDESN